MRQVCCEPTCEATATWRIDDTDAAAPDAYTEACTAHVGVLLNPGGGVVTPLPPEE